MSLVVEDGTGLADAESFCSVAAATAYHAARANAAWAAVADDATREAYLRQATDYMEAFYRDRWAGVRVTTTQALSWPRYEVPVKDFGGTWLTYYASDAVPTVVANACAELALRAIDGGLAPDLTRSTRRERVGEIEVEYEPGAAQYVRYRAIDAMLQPFFIGSAGTVRVVRA